MSETLLVTGGAGQLGRLVIEQLLESGAGPIIATTRDPSKLADLAARGVEVRAADFDQPETLGAAFAGASRMLLVSTDAIFVPGQRKTQHRAAISAAQKAGVKHIVYTSLPSPKPNSESLIEDDHFWTEQAIAASAMSWTFMRHGLYTDGLMWTLPQSLESGVWATATANKPCHYITRQDCARADAAALASGDTANTIYEITGPAALTAEEIAAIVAQATGRPLAHMDITVDMLRQGLASAELPPTLVGAMSGFQIATAQGFYGTVTSAVQDLTGTAPQSVADFIAANKGALAAPQ